MTKRGRSEYDLNALADAEEEDATLMQPAFKPAAIPSVNWDPAGKAHQSGELSPEGVTVTQTIEASVPGPGSSPTPEGDTHRLEAEQLDDVAFGEELLNHPFWSLLMRAGYTVW